MKNYPEVDNLVPLIQIADNLGFKPTKNKFDPKDYIPITLLKVKELYSDKDFQRLLNVSMIRKAKHFDAYLCRPLYVFKRPNGKYSVVDGQHTGTIGYLYCDDGGDMYLPCQVREHDSNATLEECVVQEANFFKQLNFRRRNVGKVEKLRADIAIGDDEALKIEEKLIAMGVHIELIGDPDGLPVYGYDKLMEAHKKYHLPNVRKAITLYDELNCNKNAPKWASGKDLNGGLISGISAVYHLIDTELGAGDKSYGLTVYLQNYLKNSTPKSLMEDTAGVSQAVLIARRVVGKCNALIENGILKKRNGESLKQPIGEDILVKAGLGDPSKVKEIAVEVDDEND
jgi:hypothetical protein